MNSAKNTISNYFKSSANTLRMFCVSLAGAAPPVAFCTLTVVCVALLLFTRNTVLQHGRVCVAAEVQKFGEKAFFFQIRIQLNIAHKVNALRTVAVFDRKAGAV